MESATSPYEDTWYVRLCRFAESNLGWLVGDISKFKSKVKASVSDEFEDALAFLGISVEPYQAVLVSYVMAFLSAILMITVNIIYVLLTRLYIIDFSQQTLLVLALATFAVPLIALYYFSEYPKLYAANMRIHSLGDTPEILSYMVMSMKLVSNMENAVRFAAENCNRVLAWDLRKLLWDIQMRIYSDIDEALSSLADRWGRWSEYFKRSIHLVKSSTSEPDEAQRVMTLNRSLDIVLEGTRNMMDEFAAQLHQPTVILYSMFVMIPLALVAMLPAVAVVGVSVSALEVAIIYVVLLPLVTFIYAQNILGKRPAAFSPPQISESHPLLQHVKKQQILLTAIIVGVVIASLGQIILLIGNPMNLISTGMLEGIIPSSLPIIWGISAAITIYTTQTYRAHKVIRDGIKTMEREFSDALFVLGRRISEGRSAEEAFAHTAKAMEGSRISEMLNNVSQNLLGMRTALHDALFDEEIGALKDVYSDRIHATMKLFVQSVGKSHEAAGVAIVKLADHLKELQEVEERIKRALYDTTSMMRSTTTLFAPLIGGVTLGLSEVVGRILMDMAESAAKLPSGAQQAAAVGLDVIAPTIPPGVFVLCIGIYILLLTAILTYFAGGIDSGGDAPQFMYDLGRALPMAVVVFTVATVGSRMIFSTLV